MATKSPRGISTQEPVPSFTLTQNPNVSTVDAIVRERLSPPLSPTSAQLKSKEQVNDQQLQQKHKEACQLIDNDPEQARVLFKELITDVPKTEAYWLFLADCKLRFAYACPEDSQERKDTTLIAKENLDKAYKNRGAWDSLGEEEKINRYLYLRGCLRDFKILVQNDVSSLDNSVELQIEECNLHIPLLNDFYDKLNEATLLQGNEAKREVYHQALEMIEGHEEPKYLLARAFGTTSLALTYRSDDENPYSRAALDLAAKAYQKKDALFTDDQTKLRTLNLFNKLFHHLIQLFSDSDTLVAINKMLEECNQELARCQDSVPKNGDGPEPSPSVSPRVSKESVDHWKTARLMIAFTFAVVVIAGAFVLGRRYITRLN